MRILLILLLVTGLLAACDNNPFANNNRKKDTGDKTDKSDRDRNKEYDDDNYDEDDANTRSNWTKKQRNEWLDDCTDEVSRDHSDAKAKQICSCALKKIEKKYPDMEDAREAMEEMEELKQKTLKECGYKEDDEYDDYEDKDEYDDNDDHTSSGWTSQQRKQFIYGCATTAKQTRGFTAEEADSYCSCMTRKVEQKHSFKEAALMTATDFQTPEWQEAAADCLSR